MIKIGILSSFGNPDTLKQYAKQILKKGEWTGVGFPPREQIEFNIHILKPGNKVSLLDNANNLLYMQTAEFGKFKFISREQPSVIKIYDEFKGQQVTSYQRKDDKNITVYQLGDNDVEINVKEAFTTETIDTVNKHFIRFLCMTSHELEVNFSISPEKLMPPNSQTEPLIDPFWTMTNNIENNIIVDNNTYWNFKKYILLNKKHFETNYRRMKKDVFDMEINIDYKHRYYLNSKQIIGFFNGFIGYVKKEKMEAHLEGLFEGLFKTIIQNTVTGIQEKKDLPSDPN